MISRYRPSSVIACGECGKLHQYQAISRGHDATCQRCGGILYRHRARMLESALALTLTGIILFILTNFFPLLGLKAQGLVQELTLWKATITFWQQGFQLLSMLLLLNLIVFPLFELFTLLWVMLTIRFNLSTRLARYLYRWMQQLKPWGMLEVFMLGVLVAVVKLGDLAVLVIGPAFWSFAALIVCMAAATAILDPFVVWNSLKSGDSDG
uniref:Paraquat-inducible protein A n=1 Tax=uncultured Thiotrichaceae bacterium TaxID=298394 RepID=A0A6S6T8N4_9GAMM|nr:MAG: Paraquat-inducible protein A [uncultured Thiotrichaceae bacterium]